MIDLKIMRHSCEHVLTQAMLELYPGIKMAMGPATDEGFYFDFDPGKEKISEADFSSIEAKMRSIINKDLLFTRKEVSPAEAKKLFKENKYKLEWVNEAQKKGEKITLYSTGANFVDLCKGPHIVSTGKIGSFKLLSLAGAYWHGDEKNKMLVRIYGTCFPTQKELDEYLFNQEEAKKRDHRILGKKLDLFVFSDLVGKGLPLLTSKGATIRRELERFVIDEEIKRGYEHVVTPHLARVDLYKTSGHYPYYKETMYPIMKVDEDELILRPMTCPHHFMLYASRPRSYKELPVRFAEAASQFRYEKSGELTGLSRVRSFCLADAHIMCMKEQAKSEIKAVLDLIDYANQVLGLEKGKDYRYRLSLGNRQDEKKYYKDDAAWDEAEEVLRSVLKEIKAPFFEAYNEAAFYGPKIDIQMKKVSGQEETAFTVQYDFVMPKRFKLKYVDKDGQEKQPIVIHRSSIGAFERTMAFLIEHYAGNFPTWLSPVQVKILPITDKNLSYAQKTASLMKEKNIRVEVDDRSEPLGAKIRDAQMEKIPYMLIVGDKEEKTGTVSERGRSGKNYGQFKLDKFIADITKEIDEKIIN